MLIQVKALGSDTNNVCRTRVPIPAGAQGVKLLSVNLPLNAGVFSPEFPAGITIGTNVPEVVDVPEFGSFSDFKRYLNDLRTVGQLRVCYAYGTDEMDFCVDQFALTLSAQLATYLGLGTALAASKCYTTTVDVERLNPVYDFLVKFVAPLEADNHVIGTVKTVQSEAAGNDFHRFTGYAQFGVLEIFCRLRTGEEVFATCGDELWGVELEF